MQRAVLAGIAMLVLAGVVLAVIYTAGWGLQEPVPWAGANEKMAVAASSWGDRLERVATAGILIGGMVALGVASWRARSADQQANAARRQVDTALRQTEVSQQRLLDERYQQAAEMLGSRAVATRLGGIHALDRLVEDNPERYRPDVLRLLATFIRYPTDDPGGTSVVSLRDDVQAAVDAIGRRNDSRSQVTVRALRSKAIFRHEYALVELQDSILKQAQFSFGNFRQVIFVDADLAGIYTYKADFSNATFTRANITGATLIETDFSSVDFQDVSLAGSRLEGSVLSGANLRGADLSGVDFSGDGQSPVSGLTQDQLDWGKANPNNPPTLDGVVDAITGQSLVWRGGPLT